ncbi:hypothetical protein BV22DRAFT_1132463 [Leucogyrophana mollusca]|uniref:Uncharacterized protein n=1 Tax=Leucogyrophana mollusca TaxID=85980 RepID=A0ACB8B8L1_9AGAM|nr:hypothetical protein BV22DRAFT_1132463 [Leucogyrophana mollusca]
MENLDSDVSADIVRLLGQELKLVRAQLREAQLRNNTPATEASSYEDTCRERLRMLIDDVAVLKRENEDLRATVFQLESERSGFVKPEDMDGSVALRYEASLEQSRKELSKALAEKADAETSLSELQENLQAVQEEYQQMKASKRECQQVADEHCKRVMDLADELETLKREQASLACTDTDPESFFSSTTYVAVEGQPDLDTSDPYIKSPFFKLPEHAISLCAEGVLHYNSKQLMWSPSGVALGLVVTHPFQFNPKVGSGQWTKWRAEIMDIGVKKEVFCLNTRGWFYMGTYERASSCLTMPVDKLKDLDPKARYIFKRTVLNQDFIPPSQTRMVENMYTQGVLKVELFGIRCVGFNQALNAELIRAGNEKRSKPPRTLQGIPILTPEDSWGRKGPGGKKRKRSDGAGRAPKGKNKKVKAE